MMDIYDLYQEVILDHNRNPRNCHEILEADSQAQGFNPLCGDKITVFLKVDDDVIEDVSFIGAGCAISTASASLMTEFLKGKTKQQAETMFQNFHRALTKGDSAAEQKLGKLAALSGVRKFPIRVKCATLAWHTLHAALANSHEVATTE